MEEVMSWNDRGDKGSVYDIQLHIENIALFQGDQCLISRSDR